MNELWIPIVSAIVGGLAGFLLKLFLQERQEKYELRRSIASHRVAAYLDLWKLCDNSMRMEDRMERIQALRSWYQDGGGLFLSLAASNRFFRALVLLEKDEISDSEFKELQENLSWLRTEMKYHVGSYSRREAKTQIPDAK